MKDTEIPSPDTVVDVLKDMGDNTKATDLCQKMVDRPYGYHRRGVQLAMQRAISGGKIVVNRDWTLSVKRKRHDC